MWLHLVLGLTGALVLAILGVTGAYINVQPALHAWFAPIPRVEIGTSRAGPLEIIRRVDSAFAPDRSVSLTASPPGRASVVMLGSDTEVFVDPATGAIVGSRPRHFVSMRNLTAVMRGLHVQLLWLGGGALLVTLFTVEAILLTLSGIWLWWRKKAWRFGWWRGSVFRVSWDWHSASGIWFAAPLLVMSITGVLIFWPAPLVRVAGESLSPWQWPPRSATTDEGRAAVPLARALFVADSVLPAGAIDELTIPRQAGEAFGVRKGARTAWVDQHLGSLIELREAPEPNAADRMLHGTEEAHSGHLFGAAGVVVMTVGSLMLALMSATGLILGWKRLKILAGRLQRDADD